MTIVEGQVETLKKLKESLSRSGITRFGSIGEIRRFVKDFELEKKQLPNSIENEVEAEIQDMQSTLANHRQNCDELKSSVRDGIEQQIHTLETEIKRASDKSNRNIFYKVLYFLKISSLTGRAVSLRKKPGKDSQKEGKRYRKNNR